MKLARPTFRTPAGRCATLLAATLALMPLAGCVPLVLGGAIAGTALSVSDRRSAGSQWEDSSIELKCGQRVGKVIGDRGHVSCISYNKVLLLTGQVPTEAMRAEVKATAGRVEQVRAVVDELEVGFNASLSTRAADSLLTSRVKAALLEDTSLHANTIKVVSERAQVYLMGIVTESEAERAAERARAVSGVAKVVKVFEVVSPAQAGALSPATPPRP